MDNKYKNLLIHGFGFIMIPYVYFFTLRPYFLKKEKEFDSKITEISDSELSLMKKKMDEIKRRKEE